MVSAGQPILTLSGFQSVKLNAPLIDPEYVTHDCGTRIPFYFHQGKRSWTAFPVNTVGVLYYHDAGSQIRFRLCQSLEEFAEGPDLKLPDSRIWNISLARMARNPRKYRPFLACLKIEFPIPSEDIDPNRAADGRLISTVSPQRRMSTNQRIFNISGMSRVRISPRGKPSSKITYEAVLIQGATVYHRFPSNTTGIFYYHQSQSTPTQLGELRFRLCSDIQEFENGSDLCSVSGEPWFISSQCLYVAERYESIREHVIEEGLLEHSLDSGVPDSIVGFGIPHVTRLKQPFPVDFSSVHLPVNLHNFGRPTPPLYKMRLQGIFRNKNNLQAKVPLFSGELPSVHLYLSGINKGIKDEP
jgi:hypothetical protein